MIFDKTNIQFGNVNISNILLSKTFILIIILFISIISIYNNANGLEISGYCRMFPYPIGDYPTEAYVRDIKIENQIAFISVDSEGFYILDLKKIARPTLIGSFKPSGTILGFDKESHYSFLAAGLDGLRILDLSNYSELTEISRFNTKGYSYTVAINDNYAYIADSSGISILDISNPSNPVEKRYYDLPGMIRDIVINGDFAYIAADTAGLRILNISNPQFPIEIGSLDTPGNAISLKLKENYIYLADFQQGLRIIDISNPAHPQEVGHYTNQQDYGPVVDLSLQGNNLYMATEASDILILNITDPSNPYVIHTIPTVSNKILFSEPYLYCGIYSLTNFGLRIFAQGIPIPGVEMKLAGLLTATLVTDSSGYYHFQNLSPGGYSLTPVLQGFQFSPRNESYPNLSSDLFNQNFIGTLYSPVTISISGYCTTPFTKLGWYNSPDLSWSINVRGNYVYLADEEAGMRIVDIHDPYNPREVGVYDIPDSNITGIALKGYYAYITDFWYGLRIIDIRDPSNPTEIGNYITPPYTLDVALKNTYAYLANYEHGLRVIDIKDPQHPVEIGYCLTSGLAWDVALVGSYAYLACDDEDLYIIDISTPYHPFVVNHIDLSGSTKRVTIRGNYAYLSCSSGGLIILDIHDPANPVLVKSVNMSNLVMGASVSGNYVYTANYFPGYVYITNITDIEDAYSITSYGIYGNSMDIVTDDTFAYVAAYSQGFHVLPQIKPIQGVQMTLSGDTDMVVMTDENGFFDFQGLLYGTYTVRPSRSGYGFASSMIVYNSVTSNNNYEYFKGTPHIIAPIHFNAEPVDSNQIQLTWWDISNNEQGYGMDVKIGEEDWKVLGFLGSNSTGYLHTGLTAGQTYCYRIYGYNSSGLSEYSNFVCIIAGTPKAPDLLDGIVLPNRQMKLIWNDISENESGFGIEYRVNQGEWYLLDILGPNTTEFLFTSGIQGYEYGFRVFSQNSLGNSNYSNEIYLTIDLSPTSIHKKEWMKFP